MSHTFQNCFGTGERMQRVIKSILERLNSLFNITLKDSVIDEKAFLRDKTNPPEIYKSAGNNTFINPFNINTDNWGIGTIDRLLLVEFEELEQYKTIELQIINNEGEKGALVILYYAKAKQADIYYTSNLRLKTEMYANILNEVTITAVDMVCSFEEIDGLLKARLDFNDRFGYLITMSIDEQFGEMKPCGLLAPIGGEALAPKFMTIVFMKHFKFLSQKEPGISVTINKKQARLIKLPLRINGVKGYQVKYSMDPVTVSWNLNYRGKLSLLGQNENEYCKNGNIRIELHTNGQHPEIKSFSGIQGNHRIRFSFSPAIPDLQNLSANLMLGGKFSISIDKVEGIIAGKYSITTKNNSTIMMIKPTKGYSPVPGKAWMKKMTWIAEINRAQGEYIMKSRWLKQ